MEFQQTNILSMTGNDDFATTSDLAGYVSLDTTQTITGLKTFSTLPVSSVVPTTTTQLVNKSYVDGLGAGYVDLTSAQTITGAKTINANLRLNNTRNLIFGTTTGAELNFTGGNFYINNASTGGIYFFTAGLANTYIDSTGLNIESGKRVWFNGGRCSLTDNGTQLVYDVPTSNSHSVRVNNVQQLLLDATRLTLTGDMRLVAGKKVEFDATGSHYITEGTSTLNAYVPTGSTHKWLINSVEQLSLDATLGATFAGEIRMKYPYALYPNDAFTGGSMRGTSSGGWRWDADVGADYNFYCDSTLGLNINGAGISIPTNSVAQFGVAGSNITYFGATTLRYNLPTGKTHAFRINATNILEVLSTGISVVGGYLGRAGTGGAFAATYNNAFYTGAVLQAWNNAVNLGNFTICDYRIKENIRPAGNVLDRLCQVEMIEYQQKDISIFKNVGNQFGFIAHQVKDLFPELPNIVAGEKDALTSEGGIQPQTINSEFTNLYLKAIQELNAKIETQQKQIDSLLVAMAKLLSP
jgi:hypothetical protein